MYFLGDVGFTLAQIFVGTSWCCWRMSLPLFACCSLCCWYQMACKCYLLEVAGNHGNGINAPAATKVCFRIKLEFKTLYFALSYWRCSGLFISMYSLCTHETLQTFWSPITMWWCWKFTGCCNRSEPWRWCGIERSGSCEKVLKKKLYWRDCGLRFSDKVV